MSRPPPLPYLIRRDRLEDAPALARLLSHPAVFETAGNSEACDPECVAEIIASRSPREMGLVAELDGAVIGCAMLSRASPHPRRAHAASLAVAVDPERQRRGVATELLAGLIRFADASGLITRLELHVFDSEQASVSLYQALGFRIEGAMENHTSLRGSPARVLLMARLAPEPRSIHLHRGE